MLKNIISKIYLEIIIRNKFHPDPNPTDLIRVQAASLKFHILFEGKKNFPTCHSSRPPKQACIEVWRSNLASVFYLRAKVRRKILSKKKSINVSLKSCQIEMPIV